MEISKTKTVRMLRHCAKSKKSLSMLRPFILGQLLKHVWAERLPRGERKNPQPTWLWCFIISAVLEIRIFSFF